MTRWSEQYTAAPRFVWDEILSNSDLLLELQPYCNWYMVYAHRSSGNLLIAAPGAVAGECSPQNMLVLSGRAAVLWMASHRTAVC